MDDEAADLLAGEVEEAVHDGVGDDGAHGQQVEHGEQHQQPLVAVRAVLLQKHEIEYWMDNWTVSDITGHAGVTGQYLANAIISDKSK